MTNIFSIQILLEVRERKTEKILVEQTLTLKYSDGGKLFGGWIKIDMSEHDLLQDRLKRNLLHLLESKNRHDLQKIGHKIIFAIKYKDWYIDTCVLETKQFNSITTLEEWYTNNSTSNFDQFLN